MRAWRAERFGKPDEVLSLIERDRPEPGDDDVEIEVASAGVGLPDVLMLHGNYPAVQAPPISPGQEVVGTVSAAGPNAGFAVGDRVMAMTRFADGYGGFAEYCLARPGLTLPVPENMPDEQAAGFVVPYHTAYVGLVQRGELKAGETLLVLGGSGSSGSAAIELGKALGATVIATASSEEKAAFCKKLGADHVINYREQPIHRAVRQITDNIGAQMVYDPVGGIAYEQATKCIAQHGRLIFIGYGSGSWPKVDPLHVVLKSYSLVGAFAGARTPDEIRQHHDHLSQLVTEGKISVPVDKIFPFEEVPKAITRVEKGEMTGKVIVKVA